MKGATAANVIMLFIPVCASLRVRVVSFNIHAWRDKDHIDSFQRLCDLLIECEPDVICLNECLHPWAGAAADDPYWQAVASRRGNGYKLPPEALPADESKTHLLRLARLLGFDHVCFGCASPVRSFFGQVPFGNAVISRFALENVRHNVMHTEPNDLYLGEQERTMADLEDRSVSTMIVDLPGGRRLGVCTTHLDHKAEELREKQARNVLAAAAKAFGSGAVDLPYLVCGDLNTYDKRDMAERQWREMCELSERKGWSKPRADSLVRAVLEGDGGLVDAFSLAAERDEGDAGADGAGLPPATCWTGCRLDYVLLHCAGKVQVAAHRTLSGSACSDHLPIVCDLEIE